jgi:predicted ATPase/DNA-binding SARP family transcriptional activator/DNA-binding CsgD family transcriptional regulator
MPRLHREAAERRVPRERTRPEALRVRLLGGFWVSVGERSIGEDEWRLKKAASLVKLLALEPRHRMHRERLMDLLWPGLDAKAAANDLHHALHFARRTLKPEQASLYLSFQGDLLALCPKAPLWVDVESFESAAGTARRARHPTAYRSAIELYAGELLPQDRYESWAEERREGLRLTHQTLLVELAGLYEELGELSPAVETLRRVVAAEPTHEGAQAGLMRLYALCGRREEALRQYERFEEVLAREFGARPDENTRRLREEIRASRFSPARPKPGARPPDEPAVGREHNLPVPRTSFVGREHEVVQIGRLLSMTGLLTLVGAGGSGKTRLALEAARELVGAYPDGVWLVELAPLSEEALVPQAVAEALGVREQPGNPLASTLADALKGKEMLLVLDNCEHLVETCARLAQKLLTSCPRLKILATSREALNIAEETTWLVPPLSLPDPLEHPTVGELEGYASARLFVERTRRRRTGFAPGPQNVDAIADICRRLDGIPLAIELAAARVGSLSVQQISERLEDSLDLLAGGREVTERHRTLRATMDWSYELLDRPERELFGRLAVFAGSWTLEAAEAVGEGSGLGEGSSTPSVLDVLGRLVDKSLVLAESSENGWTRYRLLEPVRQYAREKLNESGETPETRRRHAGFYLSLVEKAEPELTGPRQAAWLDRLEAEFGNLRAALGWSLEEEGDRRQGLRLAGAMWRFFYTRGYYGEGREWLEGTLARSEGSPADLRAKALTGAGVLAFLQCEYERAATLLEESLTLYRDLEDRPGVASALQTLGSIARERGHYARAVAFHEESLALQRDSGNDEGVARALVGLGFAAWLQEDYERAWTLCTRALALYRGLENTEGIAWSLVNLGAVAQHRDDHERATRLLNESLTLSREAGYTEGVAWSLHELGLVAFRRGDAGGATVSLKESLRVHYDLGDRWRTASVLEGLAASACSQAAFERAAFLFGAADSLRETIGTPVPLCERPDRDRNLEGARARLDKAAWETAWYEGRAMPLGEAIDYALAGEPGAPPAKAPAETRSPVLTRRQREISVLISRGLTSRQIAARLALSEHTVNTHVARILSKLDLRSRAQLVAWLAQNQPPGPE